MVAAPVKSQVGRKRKKSKVVKCPHLDAVVRVLVQVPQDTPAAGCVHLPDGALHQPVLPLETHTEQRKHMNMQLHALTLHANGGGVVGIGGSSHHTQFISAINLINGHSFGIWSQW